MIKQTIKNKKSMTCREDAVKHDLLWFIDAYKVGQVTTDDSRGKRCVLKLKLNNMYIITLVEHQSGHREYSLRKCGSIKTITDITEWSNETLLQELYRVNSLPDCSRRL